MCPWRAPTKDVVSLEVVDEVVGCRKKAIVARTRIRLRSLLFSSPVIHVTTSQSSSFFAGLL